MDRTERIPVKGLNAELVGVRAALDQRQANIWTALPATVSSFNAGKATVEAQPTIQAQILQPDGTWVDTTLPLCLDCPVMFPGCSGFTFTFPLAAGDEGLLIFASRCIDAWWQSGGVQKQAELRMHDLSDGFFLPTGGMSNPKVPANISTTAAQLRASDGNTYLEIAPNGVINVVAATQINFNSPTVFNEGVAFLGTVSGHTGGGGTVNFGNANLETSGDLKTGSVGSVNTHVHTGVITGADDSGPPAG